MPAAVLHELSQGNSQVLVSTHNPLFVSGEGFEDVRMVRKDQGSTSASISYMSYAQIADAVAAATGEKPIKPQGALAKVHQALQPVINEMFFTRRLILVEGLEDVAYLLAYFNLLDRSDKYRRMGCHIVPANGKSELVQPLIMAKHMGIPTYLVFDADADKPDKSGSRAKHEKDNKALLTLSGKANENPMPEATVWGTGFTCGSLTLVLSSKTTSAKTNGRLIGLRPTSNTATPADSGRMLFTLAQAWHLLGMPERVLPIWNVCARRF